MRVRVRVLLTEGSSLTSREAVTYLGSAGYHLEVQRMWLGRIHGGLVCLLLRLCNIRLAHLTRHAL